MPANACFRVDILSKAPAFVWDKSVELRNMISARKHERYLRITSSKDLYAVDQELSILFLARAVLNLAGEAYTRPVRQSTV